MGDALLWWMAVQGIALAALPLTVLVFRSLPDRGYAFAKILGPLLLTLVVWGVGLTHAVPIARGVVWALFYAFLLSNLLLLRRARPQLRRLWRVNRRAVVTAEVLFAAVYVLWCVARAFSPAIEGTEKPMDLAMLNAAFRSTAYPPEDPWLAGYSVAYYYLGYLTVAVIAKLTGISSAVAFNLAIATLAAQAAVGAFAVAAGLAAAAAPRGHRRGRIGLPHLTTGLLASFLLLGISNLQGVLELARARGLGSPEFFAWVNVKDLRATGPSTQWYPDDLWFWWRSTRVIDTVAGGKSLDYTIAEYPFFSFLLGDLHPHVMALPLTLLALGVVVALVLGPARPRVSRAVPLLVFGPAVVLGALGFTNIWDLPAYAVILVAAGALRVAVTPPFRPRLPQLPAKPPANRGLLRVVGRLPSLFTSLSRSTSLVRRALLVVAWMGTLMVGPPATTPFAPAPRPRACRWLQWAAWAATVLVATVGLFLPFYFGTLASSIGGVAGGEAGGLVRWWTGPASRPLHTLLFWGPLLLAAGAGLWALAGLVEPSRRVWARAALLFPVALWASLELQTYRLSPPPDALSVVWTPRIWPALPLVAGATLLWQAVRRARAASTTAEARAYRAVAAGVLLLGAGLALIAVCEWVYLRDVFNNRMNTVFKLYYQAWTLLAVGSAFALYYALAHRLLHGLAKSVSLAALGIVLLACAAVTPAALANRSDGFRQAPTLDGLAHLAMSSPGELAAVAWLRSQSAPKAILEAPGPQYSRFAQVSARTGIPTLLGWPGHESQWRGNLPVFAERERDADAVYQAADKRDVLPLLRRYGVEFVVVGPAERSKYPPGALQAFDAAFPVAFREGNVTLYRVP